MTEETVKAAAGVTTIVIKGTVRMPVQGGMIVEAYHAPMYSSNILSVNLLSRTFEVLFSTTIRGYEACYFLMQNSMKVMYEFRMNDGYYPMDMLEGDGHNHASKMVSDARENDKDSDLATWHRQLVHISADRYFKLSEYDNDVPKFDRELPRKHQYIPCIHGNLRRAT